MLEHHVFEIFVKKASVFPRSKTTNFPGFMKILNLRLRTGVLGGS
jgi:hypothetical protein